MGLFGNKQAAEDYRKAKKALDKDAPRQKKVGREDARYHRLNKAVGDAQKSLPWWRR